MGHSYRLYSTARFLRHYEEEVAYSVDSFGVTHAEVYFKKVEQAVLHLGQNPTRWKLRGKNGEYRISHVVKGIHILYHLDENQKTVTVIDIGGKSRFHQLSTEAEHRKTHPHTDHRLTMKIG